MIRECTGCGTEFETQDLRRQKCKKNCGRSTASANGARKTRTDAHAVKFVAVDGEGVTYPDPIDPTKDRHDYILLSVGDRSLHKNGERLTHVEIFEFLWECFQDEPKDTAFVGFFLGYDFTQWLKSLPEERVKMLLKRDKMAKRSRRNSGQNHTPFPVEYQGWEFDMLGTKRFKLRRACEKIDKRGKDATPWMYICDTGPFFQTSFLNAIDPAKWPDGTSIVTPEEFEIITQGKADRSAAVFGDEMIRYNINENAVLAKLMKVLNHGFVGMGITLKKSHWYGPGAAVMQWMNSINAPTTEEIETVTPRWAIESAKASYYGGWFETFAHGHVPGTSYEYDINSAYPAIMETLPCLLHGKWTQGKGPYPTDGYTLVHCLATGTDDKVGPLPYRSPKGTILRPSTVSGWYWLHEVEASGRAGLIDTCAVDEWMHYEPCSCPPPLTDIANLYQKRLVVGKNSPQGKAAKLVYNSAYGKTAQSIGMPKYANPFYASLITAGCRVMILDAIATHPRRTKDLLMVATDGIYFHSEHPTLPINKEKLGWWDVEVKENLTLFMPGVYWDDKTRKRIAAGGSPVLKSRGISARDLARKIEDIDHAFTAWRIGDEWPIFELTTAFSMTSAALALARGKWHTCGDVLQNGARFINSDPLSKRDTVTAHEADGYIQTWTYETPPNEWPAETTPYAQDFGMPDDEDLAALSQYNIPLTDARSEPGGITPDGYSDSLFYGALRD